MGKKLTVLLTLLLITAGLIACSNKDSDGDTPVAKATDFNEAYFKNDKNQYISFVEDKLVIHSRNEHTDDRKITSLDTIIEELAGDSTDFNEYVFQNASIETKGDQYFVKADEDIELVFTKIGERTIKDKQGSRYTTQVYPE